MPAIYHEGSWLGNATDPEVLVKDTVGWTGKNRAFSQTNNAVIAHIENGITYDVSWTGSATITLKKNSASGATITSGSTSPLRFTADADYELYFGSSANVTEIMVKDSRITDPTYEPYHESVEEEIEQIYADNGVLGAKNLLKVTANTQTLNGVTFTVNRDSDGNLINITVNGTATAVANFNISLSISNTLSCILNGCPSGGSDNSYRIGARYNNSGTYTYNYDTGSGCEINDISIVDRVFIQIANGQTVNNLVFKPMLRLASDPDDTYQPYAMTNRELTEKVTVKSDSITSSFTANGDVANGLKKIGEIVFIDAAYKEVTASQWGVIAIIPAGFRPKTPCRLLDGYGKKSLVINVNGDIQAAESISNNYVYIHGSWVVS